MFGHEEAEQKEVVKKTGNIVRNKKRSNPQIRLSDDPGDHQRHNYLGASSAGHVHPGSSSVKDAFAMDNYQDSSSPKGNYNLGSNSARHNSLRVVDSLGFKSSRIASHSEDDCESSIRTSHTTHPVLDSWTADHRDHKWQSRVGEENSVNSFPDRWNPQSHDDNKHRSSSLEGHDPECESPDVASGLRHNHDYHRYDDHTSSTQARDASHGIDQDLVSKSRSRDDYHKYKHDDHPGSSPAENASNVNNSNRKRRKSKCLVNSDDEFLNTRVSTVTITRAERDEEPFDICRMPNFIAPRELSPPPQSNETYKEIQNLMPGMFLLKKWLTEPEQAELVKKCQELGLGNGGFFQPSFDSGKKMCLRMMCLGVNWNHKTYKYEEIRAHDNAQPPPIPSDFIPLVKRAIEDSHNKLNKDHNIRTQEELLKALPSLEPDVCIVNFYEESGRLGVHQDKDESRASLEKGLPVVSFSIGDTAEFCYGKERKLENLNEIKLESGDVLIFGGESRHVFHGVSKLCPATAPRWLTQTTSLRPGRLNLTFRQISI